MAVPGGNELWINPAQTSYHTLAHEFVHLLQGSYNIPTGEKSCDVYAMARHWTLNDAQPYYVRVPTVFLSADGMIRPECARLIFTVARQSIEKRNSGLRNYIAYFEKTLKALKQRPPQEERSQLIHQRQVSSKDELAFPRPK
jgi:Zn-dependent peptidase ImmA (M78 family)